MIDGVWFVDLFVVFWALLNGSVFKNPYSSPFTVPFKDDQLSVDMLLYMSVAVKRWNPFGSNRKKQMFGWQAVVLVLARERAYAADDKRQRRPADDDDPDERHGDGRRAPHPERGPGRRVDGARRARVRGARRPGGPAADDAGPAGQSQCSRGPHLPRRAARRSRSNGRTWPNGTSGTLYLSTLVLSVAKVLLPLICFKPL